jgi:potassium channel subfamily K
MLSIFCLLVIVALYETGYGDAAPLTPEGRAWAIVFIPLAVASAGEVLGNVASAVMERRQRAMYKFLMGRDVTLEHLMQMDENQNGQVSKREYVEFMLLEMCLVSQGQIKELHEQFERLDVTNTGYLDVEDLKLMAEIRGATVVNVAKARSNK